MIPGDGVGPEIMDSVEEVLNSIGAPIDFEVHHLSEVHKGGVGFNSKKCLQFRLEKQLQFLA